MKTLAIQPLFLILALSLAACGHGSSGKSASSEGATQVVAKVNDKEISVHQLNLAMGDPAGLPKEQLHAVAKQTLDKLVEQQLLAQQALSDKLDRDPRVVQALEAARDQVLARAWLDHVAAQPGKPSKEDVDKFYADHPELFSARRIYRLQELQLQAKLDVTQLEAILSKGKSLPEVARLLAEQKVGFNDTTSNVASEQLPLRLAAELAKLKVGNLVTLPTPQGGMNIAAILGAQEAPVSLEQARPAIENFLQNERRGEAVRASLKSLHDKAKISYLGEFDPAKEAATSAAPAAAPAAPAADSASKPADAPAAASATPGVSDSSVSKGISGLK